MSFEDDHPAGRQSELTERLILRWEFDAATASNRWVRHAIRFAVTELTTDTELGELLDRMQAGRETT